MADAQAENAQGNEGGTPQGTPPEALKTGQEEKTVPKARFDEVYGELKQSREEMGALRQQFAELQAKVQQPQDKPPPEDVADDDPEKVFERVARKTVEPLTGVVARLYDKVDELSFARSAAGLPAEDITAAEKLRTELQQKGVYANRDDALALALGRKALEARRKAAADEDARVKANAYAFSGDERPGSSRPAPEPDLDSLPPGERARRYAERLGDVPI